MKTAKKIIWGLILICAGVIFALNALDVTDVDVFFDGWWTLFIIVPCLVGLFTERDKGGNLAGLLIGVAFLLWCRDILPLDLLWKLLIPVLIILVGVKLVLGALFGKSGKGRFTAKDETRFSNAKHDGSVPVHSAIFSGDDLNFGGQIFEGAELNAVFGGLECDLRNAVIEKDCIIRVNAIFGGIDILVPYNVSVKTRTHSLFGGVSNKAVKGGEGITVFVEGGCMFGGVEIK